MCGCSSTYRRAGFSLSVGSIQPASVLPAWTPRRTLTARSFLAAGWVPARSVLLLVRGAAAPLTSCGSPNRHPSVCAGGQLPGCARLPRDAAGPWAGGGGQGKAQGSQGAAPGGAAGSGLGSARWSLEVSSGSPRRSPWVLAPPGLFVICRIV